jgi:hypothetical protein
MLDFINIFLKICLDFFWILPICVIVALGIKTVERRVIIEWEQ